MKKITYSSEVDAAYIYLTNIGPGEVTKTVESVPNVILDFNKHGQLIGIEVLNVSKLLTDDLLKKAE